MKSTARPEGGTLVGPDNGMFAAVFERYPPTKIVSLYDPAFMRDTISDTFHGRDVFAPIATHLARGVHITELGDEVTDPVHLNLPKPRHVNDTLRGAVLLADHFGNLITNLRRGDIENWMGEAGQDAQPAITVELHDLTIPSISRTFAEVGVGEPVAYVGSSGRLEIALRNDSAARHVGYTPQTEMTVTLRFQPAPG